MLPSVVRIQVIDDRGSKEGRAVRERGLIDDDRGALGLDALHDALNGGVSEVVAAALHGEPVDADHDFLLPAFLVAAVALRGRITSCNLKHTVCDEVLPRTIALDNCLDQVFRHVLIVGQKLFGVFREAVAAIPERGVVVIISDAWIQADTFDNRRSFESLDLGVGIKLVEIRNAEGKVGVDKELGGLSLRAAHEERLYRVLDCSLLEKGGKDMCCLFCLVIAADNDSAGIEVIVERFGFPEKLRAEDDPIKLEECFEMLRIADRDCGFDDNDRRLFSAFASIQYLLDDRFHRRAVKEIGFGIVIGGGGDNDKVRICIRALCIQSGTQVKRTLSAFGLGEIFPDVFILNRGEITIQFIYLLRDDVYCSDFMVLSEEHCQGETDIAGSRNRNPIGPVHRDRFGVRDKQGGWFKP